MVDVKAIAIKALSKREVVPGQEADTGGTNLLEPQESEDVLQNKDDKPFDFKSFKFKFEPKKLLVELDPEKQKLFEKFKFNPEEVTFKDFGDMVQALSGENPMVKLKFIDGVLPKKEYSIPDDVRQKSVEEGKAKGLEHAKQARESTRVEQSDLPTVYREFEIKKVSLPNGKVDLALYIDGEPWKFQPDEKDDTPEFGKDFLLAHDIMRHGILNRDRTHNTTIPGGEHLTGQAPSPLSMTPFTPMQYDGLIANVADTMVEKETGSFSFQQLSLMIGQLRSNPDIPVGASIKLRFKVPPADISWEYSPKPDEKTYYFLGDKMYQGNISLSGIGNLESTVFKESTVTHSTKDEGEHVVHVHQRPSTKNDDLTECYEIKRGTNGAPVTGHKYFQSKQLGEIPWTEGKLREQGMTHTDVKEGIFSGRVYLKKVSDVRQKLYVFSEHISALSIVDSSQDQFTPFYTGHPYKRVELEDVRLSLPEGTHSSTELQDKFQPMLDKYRTDFELYEAKREEILESGTLPIDKNISIGRTLLASFEDAVNSKVIPKPEEGTLLTVERCQEAIHASTKKFSDAAAGFLSGISKTVAPFPPPPFRI